MTQDGVMVHGFFRVNIEEDGKIVGDSGWHKNVIVNLGFNDYLVQTLGALAGSKVAAFAALGTGSEPGAAHTTLDGELVGTGIARAALTNATTTGSKTLDCRATFSSANSFTTGTSNISNIGLFDVNTEGSLFCGNTFASSSCATNQNVNVTYQIVFS